MDIQGIFQQAKDDLLRDGKYLPHLYVQLAEAGIRKPIIFTDFPYVTTIERQKALFGLGFKFGHAHYSDEILEICFVVEMWVSALQPGEERQCAPSKDPHRREVLTAQVLSIAEKSIKHSLYMSEIIRIGDTIDLAPFEVTDEVDNRLLPVFLAGFQAAKLPPEHLASLMAKAMEKR